MWEREPCPRVMGRAKHIAPNPGQMGHTAVYQSHTVTAGGVGVREFHMPYRAMWRGGGVHLGKE